MTITRLAALFVSPWLAFASHAEPLLISDIFEQAKSENLLRLAMPVHSGSSGQISFEIEHRDDTRTLDEIYTFSMSDIEGGSPASHVLLDTRSNTAWTFNNQGSFRGVYSVVSDVDGALFFEGGQVEIKYPYDLTIDAVILPLEASPALDIPEVFDTYAAFGNGVFESGFGDIPAGATLGPSGSNIITTEDDRLFVWRPFGNAEQIYVWEIINNSESLAGHIVDFDDFVSAVTLETQ